MILRKGQKLPGWRLATVGGTSRALHDFYGRPALFVGWASWDSSRELLPDLEGFYQEHRDRFELATIAFEAQGPEYAMRFLQPAGATHTLLVDGAFHLCRAWGIQQLPFAVLADAEGYAQLVGEPGRQLFKPVLQALKRKPDRRELRVKKPGGVVEHPRLEILVQACTNFLSRRRVDDAAGALREAQALDPGNRILARQILALLHPAKFYSGAIDLKWLRGQEPRRRVEEAKPRRRTRRRDTRRVEVAPAPEAPRP